MKEYLSMYKQKLLGGLLIVLGLLIAIKLDGSVEPVLLVIPLGLFALVARSNVVECSKRPESKETENEEP